MSVRRTYRRDLATRVIQCKIQKKACSSYQIYLVHCGAILTERRLLSDAIPEYCKEMLVTSLISKKNTLRAKHYYIL